MKLYTLDIGSFNIKINAGEILENRFILDNVSEKFGAETLEYEGNTYFFGKGTFDKTMSKVHKNFIVPFLYGLGKAGAEGDINTILHLPSSQIGMKQELIEQLKDKTFKFKVNNEDKEIIVNTVGVLKEGFSSFYALAKRNEGLIAIGDIGGRSSDWFFFNNGVLEKEISVPIGMMDYFKDIANELNNKGQNRKLEDIHKLIVNEIISLDDYVDIAHKFVVNMMNEVKIEVEAIEDYNIKLCGGGAIYIKEVLNEYYAKVELINNSIKSNVTGAENIGKAKGLDK